MITFLNGSEQCRSRTSPARDSRSTRPRGDLGQGLVEVLGRDRLAVEVGVAELAEQVEDALALVGQRDDAGRHALDGVGPVEGLEDLAQVVAVDDLGLPAEGGELAVDRVHVQDLLGGAGLLEVVAVDDQREVVELILGGRGGGLPVLALVELAVAGHDVGVIALLVDPGRQRMADADREPLAERAGRRLDAGEPLHVGVALRAGCRSSAGS